MAVAPIPAGYATITPYLIVDAAAKAIEFYKKAFDAKEIFRMDGPNGTIVHAELQIGDSRMMLADEMGAMYQSAKAIGSTPVSFMVYVENVDARFAQAVAAGATVKRPVADQFYGDRTGTLVDPFGHVWSLATHVEDVAPDEMDRRLRELMASGGMG